jgi:hypothetical protein
MKTISYKLMILKNKNLSILLLGVFLISIFSLLFSESVLNILINASGSNSADLIIGKRTVDKSEEVSICILSNSNLNLAESTIWLTYDRTSLEPVQNILKVGDFTGPANESGNYLPPVWNPVLGRNNTWSLGVQYIAGEGVRISNTTPNSIAKLKFNKLDSANSLVSIDPKGTSMLSTQNGLLPIVQTIKTMNGDCSEYGSSASEKPSPLAPILDFARNTVRTGGSYTGVLFLILVTTSVLYFVYRYINKSFSVKDIFK